MTTAVLIFIEVLSISLLHGRCWQQPAVLLAGHSAGLTRWKRMLSTTLLDGYYQRQLAVLLAEHTACFST